MKNITFTMIKPYAVKMGYAGQIISLIENNGFKICALKMVHLTLKQASEFYAIHKGKKFFDELVEFMSSGPIFVAVLEKENAVEDYRHLIGATDPAEAEEGTIRKLYAQSKTKNAVHGADSDENAVIESRFFFSSIEMHFSES